MCDSCDASTPILVGDTQCVHEMPNVDVPHLQLHRTLEPIRRGRLKKQFQQAVRSPAILGIFGHIWDIYGIYMGYSWDIHGIFMGYIWDIYIYMIYIWDQNAHDGARQDGAFVPKRAPALR